MNSTCQSEVGKLKSIFIKPVANAFHDPSRVIDEWESLNYKGRPDHDLALKQYEEFESRIRSTGADVYHLPANEKLSLDSVYCRDAAIATDYGMILCNMGKDARKPEPDAHREAFVKENIPILGTIMGEGTVEGGDVAWVDQNTLAAGRSYRTNPEGIRQLKELLQPHGIEVHGYDLPHWRGPNDIFHLMSIFSPLDYHKAVVFSKVMPIAFRRLLLDRDYELIEVAEEEYDNQGCNVLALEPSKCLMVSGSPKTKAAIEKAGCEVVEYDGSEISVKGEGGPTCLTRPIERYV
jgi:N-dimethylarginine dimethylaminohydrolase